MKKNSKMTRISLYIDSNLASEVQVLAEREKRSVSFYVSSILEKFVSKKRASFIEKCKEGK